MAKSIVLCADGTWDTPHTPTTSDLNTNVRTIYLALANDDSQLKYYDSGVGTDGTPLDHLTGGALGDGLFQKIRECYAFLYNVYDAGDKIFIIGFSRGAFTARSVAGLIAEFGVPTVNLDNQTATNIFAAYRQTNTEQRQQLKDQLTTQYGLKPVTVEMVGVWDTVGALGVPGVIFNPLNQKLYGFLDTSIHPCITHGFHAVSIDEERAEFKPTLWTQPDGSPLANDSQVEQVWFPGVHCDVGGSYPEADLSNITLSWMMQKAKSLGLVFTAAAEAQYLHPLASDAVGPIHQSWKLIPWGLPEHRQIPAVATMANTVQDRLNAVADYKPENVKLNGRTLEYSTTEVLAYAD